MSRQCDFCLCPQTNPAVSGFDSSRGVEYDTLVAHGDGGSRVHSDDPRRADVDRAWRSRSWFEQGVLVGLLSVCVLFGGEKTRSGVGPLGDRALPGVTAEEIAQGWRLESVAVHQGLQVLRSTLARGLREGRGKVK